MAQMFARILRDTQNKTLVYNKRKKMYRDICKTQTFQEELKKYFL